MAEWFSQDELANGSLDGKRIAVLGYGSQGRAQALNLRDSGLDVGVGIRAGGPSSARAVDDGFSPQSMEDAADGADLVAMLMPDMAQPKSYEAIKGGLKSGATLLFSHGFNIHYKTIAPDPSFNVAMVAPKSPGRLVRMEYEIGRGVPCLVAVHQDATGEALRQALAYATGLGGHHAGVLKTTFEEETETDLFGEQAVLCGGASELVIKGFETLVEAGYQPEAAYFECLHELKLIVDLFYEGGITRMLEFVSDTAKYGDLTRGKRVVNDETKAEMRKILDEIRDGRFAKEWTDEWNAGGTRYDELRRAKEQHQIEEVGKELRKRMSWLGQHQEQPKATA
ncbi:MAG: ketol-acid reductoisomerase [Planctomycetota bacterium]